MHSTTSEEEATKEEVELVDGLAPLPPSHAQKREDEKDDIYA